MFDFGYKVTNNFAKLILFRVKSTKRCPSLPTSMQNFSVMIFIFHFYMTDDGYDTCFPDFSRVYAGSVDTAKSSCVHARGIPVFIRHICHVSLTIKRACLFRIRCRRRVLPPVTFRSPFLPALSQQGYLPSCLVHHCLLFTNLEINLLHLQPPVA